MKMKKNRDLHLETWKFLCKIQQNKAIQWTSEQVQFNTKVSTTTTTTWITMDSNMNKNKWIHQIQVKYNWDNHNNKRKNE